MTDADLVAERLAFIETCVRGLRELARPDLIEQDVREEPSVSHTLQRGIQAASDVASQIVSHERLGEPGSNRAPFALPITDGWVPESLAGPLAKMAGFRAVLVHGYQDVEKAVVRDVLAHRLGDLSARVDALRWRMKGLGWLP